jgi:hypothetical protein
MMRSSRPSSLAAPKGSVAVHSYFAWRTSVIKVVDHVVNPPATCDYQEDFLP